MSKDNTDEIVGKPESGKKPKARRVGRKIETADAFVEAWETYTEKISKK